MDTKQKYVRLKDYSEIIIFPMVIEHSKFKYLEPISAGFCYVDGRNERVSCFGDSFSLNLKSNEEEDSRQATLQLFGFDAVENLLNQ